MYYLPTLSDKLEIIQWKLEGINRYVSIRNDEQGIDSQCPYCR